MTPLDSDETLEEDGNDGGPIVSDRARKDGKPAAGRLGGESSPDVQPLYSHIRELDPNAARAEGQAEPAPSGPAESGFFAQAARISMGTAFPALRSVARFLSLESYRSLPKHDRLPDLEDVVEAELDDLLEAPEEEAPLAADQLLDWDELEVEEVTPTPYQRYLFELRIKGYLRQTKEQLSPFLLANP